MYSSGFVKDLFFQKQPKKTHFSCITMYIHTVLHCVTLRNTPRLCKVEGAIKDFWVSNKVSLLGVDSLWDDCMFDIYSGRLGVIGVYLHYFALFEDFSL